MKTNIKKYFIVDLITSIISLSLMGICLVIEELNAYFTHILCISLLFFFTVTFITAALVPFEDYYLA